MVRKYVTSTLAHVEQCKRDKHSYTYRLLRYDFITFGFSSMGSFVLKAQELLYYISQHNCYYARVTRWEAHS